MLRLQTEAPILVVSAAIFVFSYIFKLERFELRPDIMYWLYLLACASGV